jgi:hypothetical protein
MKARVERVAEELLNVAGRPAPLVEVGATCLRRAHGTFGRWPGRHALLVALQDDSYSADC